MTWFRVDDALHSHVKSMRAGDAAMGLWVLAGSWSSHYLTDGFIPVHVARRLSPSADELAATLVDAGLWTPEERNGEKGWSFRGWTEYQFTREQVEQERTNAAQRQARRRETTRANTGNASRRDYQRESQRPHTHTHTNPGGNPPYRPPQQKTGETSSPEFDRFYAAFPRHKGKQQAKKAWDKAVKAGTDPETMIAGAERYRNEKTGADPKYIKHPSTWINAGCWDDEPDQEPEFQSDTERNIATMLSWGQRMSQSPQPPNASGRELFALPGGAS